MKERLLLCDIAKGICIILVVIGHYHPDNAPDWYTIIHRFIYSFHMPFFIFTSGYIYNATKRDIPYKAFVWKKIKRLVIPYISTSVIIVALKFASQRFLYVENQVTALSFLEILYKPAAGYFLWFIWVLWWAFLIVPFFKTTKAKLLLFVLSLLLYAMPWDLGEYLCLNMFGRMFVFFVIGILSYEFKEMISKLAPFGLVIVAAFALSEIFYLFYPDFINTAVLEFITSLLGIYVVYVISKFIAKRSSSTSLLLQISATSYVIYLLHTTFEGLAKGVIDKIGWLASCNNDIVFSIDALIIIAMGVFGPFLLQKYILQKFSTTRLLFGLK